MNKELDRIYIREFIKFILQEAQTFNIQRYSEQEHTIDWAEDLFTKIFKKDE